MKRPLSRIDAIKSLAVVPAVALGVGAAISGASAATPANNRKQFKYQDTPGKNGQTCAACRFFVANKKAGQKGTCTVVSGAISPKGWCIAWAKK
jgi:hypothetical protein